MKLDILQKDYAIQQSGYQLKLDLPFELWNHIPDDDPVRLLSIMADQMDLRPLYDTYDSDRAQKYPPRILLKILLYAYMHNEYSSRRIAERCRRDINFMFLLEGLPAPDHSTIARFRTKHFAKCSEMMFSEQVTQLKDLGEVSGEAIFIDGTKIESAANKYTFVWKKATVNNQKKLQIKMAELAAECEKEYGFEIVSDGQVTIEKFALICEALQKRMEELEIKMVQGRGHAKSSEQRHLEKALEFKTRHEDYVRKLETLGSRNSYSKTDQDATFMRMKEDAMKNGQLKPAYNIQHGVDSEYIVGLAVTQSPTDTPTLIPFMENLERTLPFRYEKVVADAGYESQENYSWLAEHGYAAFIKPSNYEISKTRKYKNDIGRAENMSYDAENDTYICAQGCKLEYKYTKKQTTASGYVRESKVYQCDSCQDCPVKEKCVRKGTSKKPLEERSKVLCASQEFDTYRQQARERITSDEGNLLRTNRSIQAEGSFGELKANKQFRRFLCKSKEKVTAESTLLAMAQNMSKLHNKIQNECTGIHLHPLKDTA